MKHESNADSRIDASFFTVSAMAYALTFATYDDISKATAVGIVTYLFLFTIYTIVSTIAGFPKMKLADVLMDIFFLAS